eukprot:CAMPEP_0177646224 /NCGR_PEP_ID=MMETSP0447-20121125/9663_1 /TAXON_ID=0 /ORGANISM="Stygamoeba regulata, Strain BSH-02190019" /LENGTH=117 /DNA_ID=CAMNT_0019148749 /DNA_START=121 /DNA_END=474 /DNA_ORIENTATION=+
MPTSQQLLAGARPSFAVSAYQPSTNNYRYYAAAAGLSEAVVKDRVTDVVKNFHKVDANAVTATSSFVNDLGLDSLDTVELVLALEEEFCITVPEADQESITSVDAAVSYILASPHAK